MERIEIENAIIDLADKFIEDTVKSDAVLFHRDDLLKRMREAFIAGYVNGATTVNYMQCQDCPKTAVKPPIKFHRMI